MSVLTQNSKVLVNASGGVLDTSDALIDIRSTYGVTKNGSNLVSAVKNRDNPNKFRNVGSGCVENGDGLDFASNTGLGRLEGILPFDIVGDFFIGWWGKHPTVTASGDRSIFGCYAVGSPSLYCYIANATNELRLSTNGSDLLTETIRVSVSLNVWNYFSLERVSGILHFCKNGYLSHSVSNSLNLITNKNKLHVANIGGVNIFSVNNFKMNDFIILNKAIHNYTSKNYLDLVFTPPTRS